MDDELLDDPLMAALHAARPSDTNDPRAEKLAATALLDRLMLLDNDASPTGHLPHPRRSSRHRRLATAAAAIVLLVAGSAVAAGLASSGHHPAARSARSASGSHQKVSSPAALRRAILAAFDSSAADILYVQQTFSASNGQTQTDDMWFSPVQPTAGQLVRFRSFLTDSDGTPTQDVKHIFTMPAEPAPYHGNPRLFQTTGEIIDVDYSTHSWSDQKDTSIVSALPGEPAVQPAIGSDLSLQQQVAAGDWSEVGTGTVDGQTAIELSSNVVESGELWVSADTYLPLREVFTTAMSTTTDEYSYLAPTAANLAQLQPPIPAGFTQTTAPPVSPGG